ncbi:MAG: SH3 domain-containing protein [Candidatus Helarchaeota archaeon]|nr:SH3 domain-containing protein [Candidatus Helarchaeota archaeon]
MTRLNNHNILENLRGSRWIIFIFTLLFAVILTACNNAAQPTQISTPSITFTSSPTITSTPTLIPTHTSTPASTATPVQKNRPTKCPGAPDISLKPGDWAMVSIEPPLPNKIRNQPGTNGELIGQVQPGENVLVVDGPRCSDGYTWWFVRNLTGLEGWTVEGDAAGYWLVDPISAWYPLPEPLVAKGKKIYELREISISPDTAIVGGIKGYYLPLATPLPVPQNIETPYPNDPRGNIEDLQSSLHAEHSIYQMDSILDMSLEVFYLEDPLSRYYINNMSYDDCTLALRKALAGSEITSSSLDPFCGIGEGIPLHFMAGIKPIQFTGGKGVRYLLSSGNYLTVNTLYYNFQGLSDDGRFFIRGHFTPIEHPYIVDSGFLMENNFGPLLAYKEGQYDEAQKSYELFNARIEELLNAGVVTLYPSLDFLDNMMASIVIK